MNKQKTMYIISGPLGAGKTSVTQKLSNQLENTVLIEGDFLFHQAEEIKKISWDQRVALTWKNIIVISRNYIQADLDVIIDFVVEDELNWIKENTKDLNVKIVYVVLMTNEETLANRLNKRNEIQYLGRSLELLQKLDTAENSKFIIDTTDKSIEEIVQTILNTSTFTA